MIWPILSINPIGETQINFPMNRPYEDEVIRIMEEAGFQCVGKSYNLIDKIRELYFQEINQI